MKWDTKAAARVAASLALAMLALAVPASAADLDEGEVDDRHSQTYRDYWGDREYEPRYADQGCVSRHVVRDRLHDAGWRDFENARPRGEIVVVEARRRSGRPFRLHIDRCSGHVVDAVPLAPPRRAAYSHWREYRDDWRMYRPGWRRWAGGPPHRHYWGRRDYR